MKRALTLILLSLIVLLGIGGCGQTSNVTRSPAVSMNVLDPTLYEYSVMWQIEVARRFPDAVVIMVHGNDFVRGQWIVGSDASREHVETLDAVIARYQQPNRPFVVISCNPDHLVLHDRPGVFYFMNSVWLVPDRDTALVTPETALRRLLFGQRAAAAERKTLTAGRWLQAPEVNGNIFEAVEAN